MQEHQSELSALFLGLNSDLQQCKRNLKPDRTGFWDRTYVKCLFSLVEGIMFRMRQIILSASSQGALKLEASEITLLAEETYQLKKNGTIKKRESYLQFLPGVRLTVQMLGKAIGLEDYVISAFSDNGWAAFQEAAKIRNRLTHPKNAKDLMVYEEELQQAKLAEQWFLSVASTLVGRINETGESLGAKPNAARSAP